jgi:hypothetical protein
MQDGSPRPRHKLYGGIAASVALHLIIAAVVLVRLPAAEPAPPEEETVSVEIVPPPEEEPPQEEQPEEQALDLTMPEQQEEEKAAEIPPPPEQPQQEAEEAGGEPSPPVPVAEEEMEAPPETEEQQQEQAAGEPPPPPPEEAEQAQAEQEPPPPPPAAEEQAQPEPPSTEQAEADQSQPPPPGQGMEEGGAEQAAEGQVLPTLRPVFEFGDEDQGSEVSEDGNAAEEGEPSEQQAETTEPGAEAESAENAGEAAETGENPAEASAPPLPADIETPSVDIGNADSMPTSEEGVPEGLQAEIAPEPSETAPEEASEESGTAQSSERPLPQAERIFSQRDTSSDTAMTAMGNIPREIRVSQLCSTELAAQLRNGSPAFNPDIVPGPSLREGTVLDVKQAAFRANAQWYNLRFRCEIDGNATRVVSFALEVGEAVPRSQWRERGFPEM